MPVDTQRCHEVAALFVGAGRVVPGAVLEAEGRARSQWWAAALAGDRGLLASSLVDDLFDSHAEVTLAEEVDREARRRLISAGPGSALPR